MQNKVQNNILLVANYRSGVGYAWWLMENFWAEISKHFASNDAFAVLIYPKIDKIPQIVSKSEIIVVEHNFSDRSLTGLRKLKEIIQKFDIKYIYLTDRYYYDWLYCLLRCWGVAKIINHDHMPGERTPLPIIKKFIKKSIQKIGFFSCDYYIGVSKFVWDRFINIACIPKEKCTFIHNGIEPIKKDLSLQRYANDQFNIPYESYIIVTCGRATFYKGIDIFIKSANILINEFNRNDVYFLHIGDGPDLDIFINMVTEFNLKRSFIFAGQRNDVHKILTSCHIGVQTSKGEAFSLAILEYLSAGLLTLAPNHCGNTEAVEHGVTGILYEEGNYRKIAEEIDRLLNNKEERMRYSLKAAESVEKRFNINRTNRELIGLIDRKLKQR